MNTRIQRRPTRALATAAASSLLVLAGCSLSPNNAPQAALRAAVGAPLQDCAGLVARFRFEQTQIDSALPQGAGALSLAGQPVPDHCLVKGAMHRRKGTDGRDYAIGFEMRLPQAWNGRFFYQGNGGLDGAVVPAQGALGGGPVTGALMQGFAVISSDAGHTGAQTPFFGREAQARLDYGYEAVAKLTPMAKSLIQVAYGKAPDRSYIGGCSNGGRHAMAAAARLGEQYDGYLVGAPGYRLPLAALTQIWGAQKWATLATPGAQVVHPMNPNGRLTDLGSGFTPPERAYVAQAILERCDALDGARDGMVHATQACQAAFDPARDLQTCQAGRGGNCLSSAQKQVLAAVQSGARLAGGQPFYSGFPWDPGIAGSDWATWKFVNAQALDPLAIGTVFSVPPTGPINPLTDDVDALMTRMQARNDTYRHTSMELMSPPGHEQATGMAALHTRGARMVIYHGVSDPIFSAEDTRQWVERVDRSLGGRGADFLRYFPVPGMNHCRGGPSTDQFDLLGPLVRWVEQGVPPQTVVAKARGAGNPAGANPELPANWSAQRSRPLCAYPSVARYKGSGSMEDAASFSCQ